jgi:hypothetical protein
MGEPKRAVHGQVLVGVGVLAELEACSQARWGVGEDGGQPVAADQLVRHLVEVVADELVDVGQVPAVVGLVGVGEDVQQGELAGQAQVRVGDDQWARPGSIRSRAMVARRIGHLQDGSGRGDSSGCGSFRCMCGLRLLSNVT